MKSIAELDQNFRVSHTLPEEQKTGLTFYDIDQSPFSILGVFREGDHYVRMPAAVSQTVNEGVHTLASCTAGGRVRFVTDSTRVAIRVLSSKDGGFPYFAASGEAGLDLYMAAENGSQQYCGSYSPPLKFDDGFEGILTFPTAERRTFTLNLPLYNPVRSLFVGLNTDATLEAAPVIPGPPVIYYGSSITQGGCAGRPGCSYQALIHHKLNIDYLNLGFSGSAKGEETMMHYIAGLTMSAFVYDYDYNAPDPAHLRATHYRGYQIVRQRHPEIPILMLTRPKYHLTEEEWERNTIVRESYEAALAAGDRNVYFLDGRDLLDADLREYALVDNVHPNDLGFFSMAKNLLPLLKEVLYGT